MLRDERTQLDEERSSTIYNKPNEPLEFSAPFRIPPKLPNISRSSPGS